MYFINDPAVITSPIGPGYVVSMYTRPSVQVTTTPITGNGSAKLNFTGYPNGSLAAYFMNKFPCVHSVQKFDGPGKFQISFDATTLANSVTVGGRLANYSFTSPSGVYDTEVLSVPDGGGNFALTKQFASLEVITSASNFTGSIDVFMQDVPALKKCVDADNSTYMMIVAGRYDYGITSGIMNSITVGAFPILFTEGLVLTTTSLTEGDLVVTAADGKVRKRLSSDTCASFGVCLMDTAMNDYAYIRQLPYHLYLGA